MGTQNWGDTWVTQRTRWCLRTSLGTPIHQCSMRRQVSHSTISSSSWWLGMTTRWGTVTVSVISSSSSQRWVEKEMLNEDVRRCSDVQICSEMFRVFSERTEDGPGRRSCVFLVRKYMR